MSAYVKNKNRRNGMERVSEKLVSLILAFGVSAVSFNAYIIG